MDSVVDFLVLESLYKISVCSQWQEGDRFRSLIDGEFWFGTVEEKIAFRLAPYYIETSPCNHLLRDYFFDKTT
jgi:hypothetical protein